MTFNFKKIEDWSFVLEKYIFIKKSGLFLRIWNTSLNLHCSSLKNTCKNLWFVLNFFIRNPAIGPCKISNSRWVLTKLKKIQDCSFVLEKNILKESRVCPSSLKNLKKIRDYFFVLEKIFLKISGSVFRIWNITLNLYYSSLKNISKNLWFALKKKNNFPKNILRKSGIGPCKISYSWWVLTKF